MPARADLAAGVQALDASDYATAHQALEPLAKSGNAEAAWHLARMYEHGWGVGASQSAAAAWYKKAGVAGKPEALFRYGECLEQGLGVVRSRKEALEWYKKAAAKGVPAAMTKVGLYALNGIAGKPNFLQARRWLNQAAEAGDAEAQAIIEDLIARRFPMVDAPGSAKPDEEAARRVLDEVKDLIAPMLQARSGGAPRVKLAQPPVVAAAKDGHVVTLPMVELLTQDASVRLGNVQIAFKPDGDDYAVQVRLPSRARVVDMDGGGGATISLGSQAFTGRWSTALHTLTDYTAELGDLRLTSEGAGFGVAIGGISGSRTFKPVRDGHFDVTEQVALTNVVIEGDMDGATRRTVRAGAISYSARYEDLDPQAVGRVGRHFGIDWRTGAAIGAVGQLPKHPPAMLKDVLLTARVKDVVVEGADGQRLGALAGGELSVAGANLDQALGAFSLTYAHEGLGAEQSLPQRARVMLTTNRVPLPQLASASLSILRDQLSLPMLDGLAGGGMPALSQTLHEARTEFRINEISVTGDAYDVSVIGVFQPAAQGFSGALDVTVGGLDKLAEAVMPLDGDGDNWRRLRALAVRKQDKAGRPVDVFNVAFASGQINVNGTDATALLGGK